MRVYLFYIALLLGWSQNAAQAEVFERTLANGLKVVVKEDHRVEWMCLWQPAVDARPKKLSRSVGIAQPTSVLPEPLRLATRGSRPLHQGVLHLLIGPHRVEGGWWDRTVVDGEATTRNVLRDYWVALGEHAGVLWIFQTRLANDETAWFLHGVFD